MSFVNSFLLADARMGDGAHYVLEFLSWRHCPRHNQFVSRSHQSILCNVDVSPRSLIMMDVPEPELDNSNGQCQMQELAKRYGMAREDMELIVYDIQQKDVSLEWLKQPRVQQIVKHRKGRWVHVSAYYAMDATIVFCIMCALLAFKMLIRDSSPSDTTGRGTVCFLFK